MVHPLNCAVFHELVVHHKSDVEYLQLWLDTSLFDKTILINSPYMFYFASLVFVCHGTGVGHSLLCLFPCVSGCGHSGVKNKIKDRCKKSK